MNNKIINFFLNKGYLIFCPKTDTFGGFHESLLWALKIKKAKKLKIILNIPVISVHKRYKTFLQKSFGQKILWSYLIKLSFREIIFSLLMSIIGNILILTVKLKLIFILNLIFRKKIDKLKFPFMGFGIRDEKSFDIFSEDEIRYFLNENVNLNAEKKPQNKQKIISFCVRDNNYSNNKQISYFASANINNYSKALDHLILKGYKIHRVGDKSMNSFIFKNENFHDKSQRNEHFDSLHSSIEKSEFYFGTSASHGLIPDLYNVKKILTNNIDYIQSGTSSSYENFAIFKKVFSIKKKKILSIEEFFFDEDLFFLNLDDYILKKEIILIENNPEEILETLKEFLIYDNNFSKKSKQLTEYEEIRKNAINNYKRKNVRSLYIKMYENSKISIPEKFLNDYLFNSERLDEISSNFVKLNNI